MKRISNYNVKKLLDLHSRCIMVLEKLDFLEMLNCIDFNKHIHPSINLKNKNNPEKISMQTLKEEIDELQKSYLKAYTLIKKNHDRYKT